MAKKVSPETKIILRNVIISYPNLIEPREDDNGNLKYSAAFVLTDKSNVADLKKAEIAAARDKFGDSGVADLASGDLPSTYYSDKAVIAKKGYAGVAGVIGFLNARSDNKPNVVGTQQVPGSVTAERPGGVPRKLTDAEVKAEVYAGCVVNVSLTAFGYDRGVKRGVTFGLNNVQLVGESGQRLDGRKAAEDEFDADLSAPSADLADLIGQ